MIALALQVLGFINYILNWFGNVARKFVLGEGCGLLRMAKHLSVFLPLKKINEPHLFSRLWWRYQEASKLKDSKLLGLLQVRLRSLETSAHPRPLIYPLWCVWCIIQWLINSRKLTFKDHRNSPVDWWCTWWWLFETSSNLQWHIMSNQLFSSSPTDKGNKSRSYQTCNLLLKMFLLSTWGKPLTSLLSHTFTHHN